MRSPTVALAVTVVLALSACSADQGTGTASTSGTEGIEDTGPPGGTEGTDVPGASSNDGSDVIPRLEVEVVADGLTIPWDVQLLPDGAALVSERDGRLLVIPPGQEPREVELPIDDVYTQVEAGLMGLAVSPDFESDRLVWACYASKSDGSPHDVRVVRLVLDESLGRADLDAVVVDQLPTTGGRHSGCRLLLSDDGEVLLVGTGDAADPQTPQSPTVLGGKVLAITPDGDALPGAPFVEGADPRILTFGHRNVQGLAFQPDHQAADGPDVDLDVGVPGVGVVWSVEHGPTMDDEVNVLVPGANYGWDPGPGYNEKVPMTDLDSFPDAVEAVWSSGQPTHATSGAVFLEGAHWGAWDGALAVAELRGTGITVFTVDGQQVTGEERMVELDGIHGRLRSLTLDDEGALWVTTSNGEGKDEVLRVTAGPAPRR